MTTYVIDNDTMKVESFGEDHGKILKWVEKNELELAVTLISEPDELALMFTIEELEMLYNGLEEKPKKFEDEDQASKSCMQALEDNQWEFEEFNGKVTKPAKPPKENDSEDVSKSSKPAKKKSTGVRASQLTGMSFCNTDKTPRAGTAMAVLTDFITNNFDTATFEELTKAFIDGYTPNKSSAVVDEKYAAGYIRGAFKDGYIQEDL